MNLIFASFNSNSQKMSLHFNYTLQTATKHILTMIWLHMAYVDILGRIKGGLLRARLNEVGPSTQQRLLSLSSTFKVYETRRSRSPKFNRFSSSRIENELFTFFGFNSSFLFLSLSLQNMFGELNAVRTTFVFVVKRCKLTGTFRRWELLSWNRFEDDFRSRSCGWSHWL